MQYTKSQSVDVCFGYPLPLIKYLRCQKDGGEFQCDGKMNMQAEHIRDGILRCLKCGQEYPIIDGIVRMLEEKYLNEEDLNEIRLRDMEAEKDESAENPARIIFNKLEMEPTLEALNPINGSTLLELGCGTGRYTTIFESLCRAILAVDFSLASLKALSGKCSKRTIVGLIHADITRLAVAPRMFDRVFSTTSLDNRDQRMVVNRLSAIALSDNGRFVYSTENYDLRSRMLGLPRARRYSSGGNYYCHLKKDEVLRETAPFFKRVSARPIRVFIPFSGFIGYRMQFIFSRIAEHIVLVRDFGELLLIVANSPIRPPEEDQLVPGNRIINAFYRWYRSNDRTL